MKTHNQRMDVIGNNISNVNTTGYKASEVTFKDVYYQTKKGASSGNATAGGKNPTQIGYGSQLGTVTQVMAQSGFTYSDSVYNVALEGEGFFQVMDENGNIFYTRAGKFSVDSYGNLCDPNGNVVLGVAGDPTGIDEGQSQRITLRVPAVTDNRASSTKKVNGYDITISASDPGEQGNISFTIVDSDTPYATKTGDSLTIYMDLEQEFGSQAYVEYCKTVLTGAKDGTTLSGSGPISAVLASTEGTAIKAKIDAAYSEGGSLPTPPPDQYFVDLYNALEGLIDAVMEPKNPDGTDNTNYDATFVNDVTEAKTAYTEAALDDFRSALNGAIEQGGVGLPDGVIPLSVDFDTLPPYSDIQALKANNTLNIKLKDENGLVEQGVPSGETDPVDIETNISFTCDKAGEFGNKYEIALKYSDSIGSVPVAKWKDSTLTITVPASTTVADIQAAIDKAASGKNDLKITVSASSVGKKVETPAGGTPTTTYTRSEDLTDVDFSQFLGIETQRLGLDGGRDNFFSDLATSLSTVTLANGRLAAEQQVDDLESIRIDSDGTIYGQHAVHGLLLLGRIDVVTFENPMGLEQAGTSLWRASLASGPAQVKIAGKGGAGEVVQSALEMSNVDLAQEFSDMIITQRGYQANSRVITVSDTMLEELVNLKR